MARAFMTRRRRVAARGVVVGLAALAATACGTVPLSFTGSAGDNGTANGLAAGSPLGSYLAARHARSERDSTRAADFFAEALAADPEYLPLLRRTFLAMAMDGRINRAVALARRVLEQSPRDPHSNLVLAVYDIGNGDYAAARADLDQIAQRSYIKILVPLLQAWGAVGEDRIDAALEILKTAGDGKTFEPFRAYHAALVNDLAGRPEAADEAYRRAMESTNGTALRIAAAYGEFLEREGRADEAKRIYRRQLERFEESPLILDALARIDRGERPARMVDDPVAGAAEALYSVASALARDNARDAAIVLLRLALHLRPEYPISQVLLAEVLEANRRWEQALAVLDTVPPDSRFGWIARLRRASVLQRLDRDDEAIALLRSMAEERPNRTDALVDLGDVLRSNKRYAEASREYGRAIARLPQIDERHWSLFYARGIAYERAKQWTEAEADFLKAIELKPDQPLVLNYLGYSWVEQGRNIERAYAMLKRAVDLRPNDGYIVDSLGWVLYRLQRFPEAVVQLEQAIELQPEDPVINDHLGDAYWRVGRKFEARYQWRRALSFNPEKELVPVIKEKLEVGLAPVRSNDKPKMSDGR